MERHLVIDAREPVHVQLDGPSLIVRRTGESARRFPVRLLKQIVVTGRQLDGLPAVTDCAAQQINVFFLSGNGELRAQLLGPFENTIDWNEWLEQCHWKRSWLTVYESAIKQQWHCLLKESRAFQNIRYTHRIRYYEEVATTLKRRWGKSVYRDVRQWLQGFITVLVTEVMAETGIAPGHRFRGRLLKDAAQLILMNALMKCREDARIKPPDNPLGAGTYYQAQAEAWRSLVIRLLISLEFRFTETEINSGFNHVS